MDAGDLDDPTIADSAMLDPTIEDLFGEAAEAIDVSALPPAPLPGTLIIRLTEMQSRGCCTKLSWSSIGSIAHISPDGSKITFRAMVRNKKTAAWTISNASRYPIICPQGRTFVHIQFSGVGIDLAAVDNLGIAHIYTLASPLSRMNPSAGNITPDDVPRTELDAIVGLHWLPLYPTEFRSPFLEPAVRNGDKWEFVYRQRDQNNVRIHHPADGRNACLHITRSGELTLLYQNDGGWHATSTTLCPIRSTDELITHADLGEDGADLIGITYDCSFRFKLFRISVNWNATQHSRGPNLTSTLVAPSLEVHHLTTAEYVRAQDADTAELTHLRLIPGTSEVPQSMPLPPMVVAIFTNVALPTEAGQSQASFSVVARWHVESFVPKLHESFNKLNHNGRSANVLNSVTVLKRQPDILTNKVILEFESLVFDTIFALGASDGSLEYRDRSSMEPMQSYGDTNTVRSLPQTGFEHMPGDHNVHVSMSADGSGLALVRADGEVVANPMSFNHGWQIIDDGLGNDNRAFVEAAAACIARQFAFLCYTNASADESLALLPHDCSREVRSMVITMISRLMNRSLDIAMQEATRQQMTVIKEAAVPRALSAQLALGTDPSSGERNSDGIFAFALLNLRSIGTALVQTLLRPDVKIIPVETFTSMSGLVKWGIDLSIFIIDTFTQVKRSLGDSQSGRQGFEQMFLETGNPALRLLLSSFSRALLRFIVAWIAKFFQAVQTSALPRIRSISEREDLMGLLEMAKSMPFKLQDFDKVLTEMDSAIREAWTKSAASPERRSDAERLIMCDGAIPDELEPAVNSLTDTILPKLTGNADLSKLYFWNTDVLGLTSSRPPPGRPYMDVIRKTPIPDGASLRSCRRCSSVMEDISPEKLRDTTPGWLGSAQRHCVCNDFWILVD